jgi:hypothetical protein
MRCATDASAFGPTAAAGKICHADIKAIGSALVNGFE